MLKVGIVGLPNVGKSTFFTALTKKQVDCANFPFCTIETNVGVVEVPDARIDKLVQMSFSKNRIPTAIEFVDIAGLVKGAHAGEGLGNKFLANIRETDMIAHVVRDFKEGGIAHVDGNVDAVRDTEIIETELIMADLASVEKRLSGIERRASSTKDKDLVVAVSGLQKFKIALESGNLAKVVELTEDEKDALKDLTLLTQKPILYIINVDEHVIKNGDWKSPFDDDRIAIPISVKIESELAALEPQDAKDFMTELGLKESGLDKVISTAYSMLELITFFTTGEEETRAWTVKIGTKAPGAAGVIHTDFEKGFIRAEVIGYDDFVNLGGEKGARDAGRMRLEGKEYVMQDADICHFRFSV
ncbi:redox-regulated ATPase YchF [Patescibacteria group bacterium]|nr:redox-regulated ATPase YchF [Patescibacteria group bacterium]